MSGDRLSVDATQAITAGTALQNYNTDLTCWAGSITGKILTNDNPGIAGDDGAAFMTEVNKALTDCKTLAGQIATGTATLGKSALDATAAFVATDSAYGSALDQLMS